jgi:hypothetical protein
LDEVNWTEVPYAAPGQITILITAEEETVDGTDRLPNEWSGNIRFDSGSKAVSYSGLGEDYFIMDCPPGTPYGVMFQNNEDSGYLAVFIQGSDYTSVTPETLELELAPFGVISISRTCPSFDPVVAEELLSYRNS